MATLYNPKIVTDGLILYLDAANPRSYPRTGTVWNDLSGNNRTTTLANTPTFDSTGGGNITFNGSNQYASTSLPASNEVTYFFWVNVLNLIVAGGEGTLFAAPSDQGSVSIVGGTNWFSWNQGGRTGPAATANTWTNIVLTGNTTSTQFYLNSVLTNSFGSGTTLLSGTGYFCSFLDLSRNLNARLGNIAFYNRVLSAQEILQNYNATRSRFGV